jgi:hypothetical protein
MGECPRSEDGAELVPFKAYALEFSDKPDANGDVITREAVNMSAHRLVDTVIRDRFRRDVPGVGVVNQVGIDSRGVVVEGRIRRDLDGKGEYACGGPVLRKEGNRVKEWRLKEVSWVQSPREILAEVREKLKYTENVTQLAHRLRQLENGEGDVPSDLPGMIKGTRDMLDKALVEWVKSRR